MGIVTVAYPSSSSSISSIVQYNARSTEEVCLPAYFTYIFRELSYVLISIFFYFGCLCCFCSLSPLRPDTSTTSLVAFHCISPILFSSFC